jgi:hypothetical protein
MPGDAWVASFDQRQAVGTRRDDRKLNNSEFHHRPPYLQSNTLHEWRNPPRAITKRERRLSTIAPKRSRITLRRGLEGSIQTRWSDLSKALPALGRDRAPV